MGEGCTLQHPAAKQTPDEPASRLLEVRRRPQLSRPYPPNPGTGDIRRVHTIVYDKF